MLIELDHTEAAHHSVINHHVDGIDYLCLHRSDKMTVKLYFIDPANMPQQVPGTYLVTPHTHRYSFESTVLAGDLIHARFREICGNRYGCFEYAPETRTKTDIGSVDLATSALERHSTGSTYWCSTSDIHTLVVPSAPVLLGLVQFGDITIKSIVYLHKGSHMDYPQSRKPTADEALAMRNRALRMMEGA
ncbi:hypothetical protein WL95_27485 [Burkholderia cepacia]|nr:hypothetical protein WL95_27485 [Burkholderia cepacia]